MNKGKKHLSHVRNVIDGLCSILQSTCADIEDEKGILDSVGSWEYCTGCGAKLNRPDYKTLLRYTRRAIQRTLKIRKVSGSVPCIGGYIPGAN